MAEATDVLTLAEGRAVLNQGSAVTAQDTAIAEWITAISERLDEEDACGPIVQRTITTESQDGEGSVIQLRHWPVVSVSAVVEEGTILTAAQYHLDTEKGLLYRQANDDDELWCVGRDNVSVTYVAGRFAATANVTQKFKRGAALLLRHMWRSEQWNNQGITNADYEVPQVAFPGFAIPNAVVEWFGSDWRGERGGFG